MSEKIFRAIRKINSNAHMIIRGNDVDSCEIQWLENTTPISKEDIKAQISSVETEMANEKNVRKSNRTSAINKLKGATYSALTDAEAKALFGA